jgi:hypothetical protein
VEFILEVVVQLVLEIFGEFLFDVGFRGAARLLRSRVVRYSIAAGVGLAFGLWWGNRLSDAARLPRLFWVSVALAVVAAIGVLVRRGRPDPVGAERLSSVVMPWRWPEYRFAGFVVLNVALAVGIFIGYEPAGPLR